VIMKILLCAAQGWQLLKIEKVKEMWGKREGPSPRDADVHGRKVKRGDNTSRGRKVGGGGIKGDSRISARDD